MPDVDARRPLKVRTSRYAEAIAKWLNNKNITPNSISLFSIGFAALAAVCLIMLPHTGGVSKWLLPILVAIFIQCRLLCNLFDGMVAIEGGKSTPSGELFNDVPDRIADALILIAAGYATTVFELSDLLGCCAALLAVMTAYVRTLASSIGAPTDFRGPMAKQHRMALVTGACVLTALEPLFWQQGYVLLLTLVLLIIGSALTVYNRTRAAYLFLEHKDNV